MEAYLYLPQSGAKGFKDLHVRNIIMYWNEKVHFTASIVHSWICNTDKNNTGLNGAWLKACWSQISSTKKYLCAVTTLFSFLANWCDFVNFCKHVIIFSISVILKAEREADEVTNCYTYVVMCSRIIVLEENDNDGFVRK